MLKIEREDWKFRIDEAEKLLIHFCTPPYNSKNIFEYSTQEKLLVMNFGRKKMLPYEISSLIHQSGYWNKDEKYGKWKLYYEST